MTNQSEGFARLAQHQLEAYNRGDIDDFCSVYAENVEVYDSPGGKLTLAGMPAFRARYARLFADNPKLHCELRSRMCQGNYVIDHERVQ